MIRYKMFMSVDTETYMIKQEANELIFQQTTSRESAKKKDTQQSHNLQWIIIIWYK